MKMKPAKISPSMMCADLLRTGEIIEEFNKQGIEYLHIDVMDGCFVPNYALSADYCKSIRRITDIPLDIHLMITDPEEKIGWFSPLPGEIVSVHLESTKDANKAFRLIRSYGALAYAAINPETPPEVLLPYLDIIDGVLVMCVRPGFAGQQMAPGSFEKITAVRRLLDHAGRQDAGVEVDGNVSFENAAKMRRAGADLFVSGTSGVFSKNMELRDSIPKFREAIL